AGLVLVLEHHANELVIDIDFGGIGDLAGLHLDAAVVERALHVRFDALQIGFFHGVASLVSLTAEPREGASSWEARIADVHRRSSLRSHSHRRCRQACGPWSGRAWRRSGS